MGLNNLYVNLRGRERAGIVAPGWEYEELLDRLETQLLALRDPADGQTVISRLTRTERELHGDHRTDECDMIVGYNWGYRSSWESPLGEMPPEIIVDNLEAWSGDHCMDHVQVPGILLSNRRISLESPALYDLTVAVLDEYDIDPPENMIGKDCLDEPVE
jgi:predicted AlkP superfamily phosphohydrolase/phosphomutase